ncbi:MAG: DUF3822 family protein [Prevotellaceae bacterium]|jgi:hypothetical protein|nr:DUF3822 family protein [Prevotellaceae bacterium]
MLNFIDKSFSTKKISQYRLSIQVDLDGFSFCVFDLVQKKHVVLKRIPIDFNVSQELLAEKVNEVYKEIEWLSQPFVSCSCIFISSKNTLIPSSFCNKETLRTFLNFAYPLDEMDEVHYKISEEVKAVAIFAIPNALASQLYTYHHNICFFNQCIPLIEYALKQKERQILAINLSSNIADIAVCRNGNFIFHNSFSISTTTDLLYYSCFVAKQLEIKPDQIKVLLSGKVREDVRQLFKANFSKFAASRNVVLPIANDYITENHLLLNLHECE